MRIIQILAFAFTFYTCTAQKVHVNLKANNNDNTLLWEVSGKQLAAPSYLFGTFHLICKDDILISNQLKAAIKNTDEMYMELDMDDPATMMGALFLMNMKDKNTLKNLYKEDEYKKVESFFKDSLHTSITMFQSMKPFFLMAMLYPKMLPCKTMSGVEQELMNLAKENKKEIKGLETMAFQASVFDSIPYTQQAKELLKTIDSLQAYKKYFDTMVRIYKNQQLKEMENLFTKSEFGMEDNQDVLLDNRNKNWVLQLNTIMKKESVFVAVGAGHLVGEMGLIALLRKEGYTVRPIENK
ncbi:MAG: TraB/GumN family protein, partial [Ferruginibacter sp.]